MRIFYVNVIERNAGWGAEWYLDRALRGLGHETCCLDYKVHRRELHQRFLDAPDSDVFLLQRGDRFPLRLVRAVRVPRFFWASELVSRRRDQDPLLKSGLFDHVFVRGRACVDEVVRRGWLVEAHCSVLLSAVDRDVYTPLPAVPKDIDVLFVGSLTPRRRAMLREVGQHCQLVTTSAFGRDAARLFNRTRVLLNIHAEEARDTETRVFEALGCRGFLLSERLSSENPFSEQDLVQFDSTNDLIDRIRYYVAHDREREAIAAHGYASVRAGHTYAHRAQQIVEVMARYVGRGRDTFAGTVEKTRSVRFHALSERLRHPLSRSRPGRRASCVAGSLPA
jgi:Glycosyl transferases group 1